jgi:flagellar hook-associated protein 2
MRSLVSQTLDGLSGVVDLGDLGISVPKATGGASTDDAKLGKLDVDDDALTESLDNDWTKVSDFFDSFSAKVDTFVRGYTGTGKGIIDGRLQSADADIKSFDDQIDTMNTRMTDEETRLRGQFAAMESALAKSQAQGSWLTAQIAKL